VIGTTDDTRDRYLPSVDRLETAMRSGLAALAAGRLEEALDRFNAALKLKPEYDAAWLARGSVLRRMKDDDGALHSFAQALRSNRESEEAWMAFASTLHGLRRPREEIDAYDELLKIRPRSVEAWVNKGAALHDLKDYRGAVACYDRALAIRPEHAPAWNNRGAALLRLRDEDGAARCFDEALHFDPDFFDANVNRALLLQKGGRHGEVVLAADRALALRETPFLWYAKGLAHLGLLEATLARKAFERALELDPDLKEARDGARRAKALREKVDLFRGVYECFGTRDADDPGCRECEIAERCEEVSP
jgi:tetratricopeptide (TPR) repeat protein